MARLSERELLALAISLEEEDERVYADFAEAARLALPASAAKSSTPCGKRNRIIAAD
jgi:rubrerythrin